jgi:hypothetical protein
LTGYPLEQHAKEVVARVAVVPVRARCKVQRLIPDERQKRLLRDLPPLKLEEAIPDVIEVPDAGGVVQQLKDRDRLTLPGILGDVFPDLVFQPDCTAFHQLEYRGRGELLGQG